MLLLGAGVGLYAYDKKKQVDNILNGLKVHLLGVDNFKADFNNIQADVYLQIVNPSKDELVFDTKFIKAKQLRIYDSVSDKNIAITDLDTTKINLPAQGTYDLPKIKIKIPVLTGADMIINSIVNKKTEFTERLRFELDLEAFDKVETFNFN